MYLPAHFSESRPEILRELISSHPLGTLVTTGEDGLDANQIPFEISAEAADGPFGTLRAHVARANPLWKQNKPGAEVLVVFHGPQTYITPSWYQEVKPATGKVVPTWNYCVVNAWGPLRVIDDVQWIRAQVERLVRRHEGQRDAPWKVSDAPSDYIAKQLEAIVGIEIPLARISGKWKVSQNRSEGDRRGVVSGLSGSSDPNAQAMAKQVGDSLEPKPRP